MRAGQDGALCWCSMRLVAQFAVLNAATTTTFLAWFSPRSLTALVFGTGAPARALLVVMSVLVAAGWTDLLVRALLRGPLRTARTAAAAAVAVRRARAAAVARISAPGPSVERALMRLALPIWCSHVGIACIGLTYLMQAYVAEALLDVGGWVLVQHYVMCAIACGGFAWAAFNSDGKGRRAREIVEGRQHA